MKISLSLAVLWGMIFGLYYVYPGFDELFVFSLIFSSVLIFWFFKSGSVSVEIDSNSPASDEGTVDGGGDSAGGDGGGGDGGGE